MVAGTAVHTWQRTVRWRRVVIPAGAEGQAEVLCSARAVAQHPDSRVNGTLSVSHWRLMIRPKVLPGVGNQLAIEELIGHARPRGSAALPWHCPLLHEESLVKAHDGVAPHQLIIGHIFRP
jgi:hypothetical protein